MSVETELVEREFFLDGDDAPPYMVKQVTIYHDGQRLFLDPDEAHTVYDELAYILSELGRI